MSLVEKQAEGARAALLANKPDLALERAMFVLTMEPDHVGMHALVAECLASVQAPSERPKLRLPSDCLWLAHHGKHQAAIGALLHVVQEYPERDWLHWAVPWLDQIPDDSLPVNEVTYYLALLIRRFPKVVRHREAERAVLRRAFPLLDALEPRLPHCTKFFVLASEVARKAADGARALRYADHALGLEQTYDALLTSATCRRLMKRTDEAVAFLRRAIELDPSSRVVLEADIGRALYEGERYAEALRHWERCDPLADDVSLHFARWRAGEAQGDPAWTHWFDTMPADLSIDEAYAVLQEPHIGSLTKPTDATLGGHSQLDMGTPRLPEPSAETRRIVEQLASSFYLLPRWWAVAPALAAQVDDSRGLAAMLTRVGTPPPEMAAWEWVQRVQRAAALLLAQRTDGFQWLSGIVLGTPDWTTAASVLALTELGLDRPERCGEVRGLFLHLAAQAPAALRSYQRLLVDCALRLPDWPRYMLVWWQARKGKIDR